jgi:hypothetical protein
MLANVRYDSDSKDKFGLQSMATRNHFGTSELAVYSITSPTVLDNISCLYCGTDRTVKNYTKEHVIGRRFVPKGKLNQSWNLIGFACSICNGKKSRLEDEISAISMQADGGGAHVVDDPELVAEATRKAKNSYSSRTGLSVASSAEKLAVTLPHPSGAKLEFAFSGPAQVDEQKVFDLCLLQIRAFLYLLTFNKLTQRGQFLQGEFFGVSHCRKADWGNERMVSFAEKVYEWEPRLIVDCIADGYAKVAIRKHPEAHCWSWSLEWNYNFRSIGFFGDPDVCVSLASRLEKITAQLLVDSANHKLAYSVDKKLDPANDKLFSYSDAWLVETAK